MRSDIYQLKTAMRQNVFSYSKTGSAPVWPDIKNYSSTFHLVTLSDKIDCGRKYEEWKMHIEPKKIVIIGIEECGYAIHFWNCGIK